MNIYREFNEYEIKLISKVSKIEKDKEYTKDEAKLIESNIIEYIWMRSSKNGDIQKANEEYSDILEKLEKVCS